ncbi:hypothetical protein F5H01DRAFT_36961 [Linnemannia elongata]|nr:hypothetical protein F5H01DRAFT_36961 [Linnemannia elongata]
MSIKAQSLVLQGLLGVAMVIMGSMGLMVDIVVLLLVVSVLVTVLGFEVGDANNASGGDTGADVVTEGVETGLGHGREGVVSDVERGLLQAWVCGVVVLLLGLEGLDGVGLDLGGVGHFCCDVFCWLLREEGSCCCCCW